MENGLLYLVNVSWRAPGEIGDITPGRLPIPIALDPAESYYEASIPAYAREAGRDMQLAVKSQDTCVIAWPNGENIPMFQYMHPDTGDHWWIEKGPWKKTYHDAPSFHRPGGAVDIRVGENRCWVHLYDPSITPTEFALLLDDIKNWCWRMAIDESCYVTVECASEVRVLSPDFLRLAEDFLRHTTALLELPHCELRESLEIQRVDRLRPNNHSLRFIAQRGERSMVPGRSARQHYDTPENRFVHAMLKRVLNMLQGTAADADKRVRGYKNEATRYEQRSIDLRSKTTEHITPSVLEEMLRRAKKARDEIQPLLDQGLQKLRVTSTPGFRANWQHGEYQGKWCIVELSHDDNSERIRAFLSRCGSAMVIGQVTAREAKSIAGNVYCICSVDNIQAIVVWRDYEAECAMLEKSRETLQKTQWEQSIPASVVEERNRESHILILRAKALREAAIKTYTDAQRLNTLLEKAGAADRKAMSLGITSNLRLVPTMVFLQSPPYAGALSAYRQLVSLTGVDDTVMEGLFALEDVGLRDWPGVYERWCLVSLLQVLEEDFRFQFDKMHVKECLLRYCTGQKPGAFSVVAKRADMDLQLTLQYQVTLPNQRVPDFMLEIRDNAAKTATRYVLDAKACNFRQRPKDAAIAPVLFIDDCIQELVSRKDYGEGGTNSVFILHASTGCIAQPTTIQSWASSSSYGGDIVFAWETERPEHHHGGVLIRPGDTAHLKRLILMLIQLGLERNDICASCGSGGSDVTAQPGHGVGVHHLCRKCGFLSVSSHCFNCKQPIVKNQAWWTYHDLHPIDVWNIKCCACGSLLSASQA